MTEINQPEAHAKLSGDLPSADSGAKLSPKRIVFTTIGSFGDIHPYIAIGLELQSRGHKVIIATSPYYREKIEATGLGFHAIRPDIAPPEENLEILIKAMDVMRGGEFIIKDLIVSHIRD